MNKTMYALTYCFEGVDDNYPYACTIAVSMDKEKLREKMMKCVEEDCTEPTDEDDDWNTDCNYQVYSKCGDDVMLQHKKYINLYTTYKIHSVEVVE
jgi:1-aminocyclopropane-1-carboxylate deaminase/D-cysteine desulfhydrase-like pyridoxal-dependent ACC family enzyme